MLKVLLVIAAIAFALYLFLRLLDRRATSPRAGRGAPPRTIAPDDDVDFLRDLDRDRRRRGEAEDEAEEA